MKNKNKVKIGLLTGAAILCTGLMGFGVYSASAQTAVFSGTVGYATQDNVSATVKCQIDNNEDEVYDYEDSITFVAGETSGTKEKEITNGALKFITNKVADNGVISVHPINVYFTISNNSSVDTLKYNVACSAINRSTLIDNLEYTQESDAGYTSIDVGEAAHTVKGVLTVYDSEKPISGNVNWNVTLSSPK